MLQVFANWMLLWQFWLIVGLLAIIVDIAMGFGFFILPFGVAALVTVPVVYGQVTGWYGSTILIGTWHDSGYWFAGFSILSIFPIRYFFRKTTQDQHDINDY